MRGARRGLIRLVAVFASLAVMLTAAPSQRAAADPVLGAPPPQVSVSQRSTMAIVTWPAVAPGASYALEYDSSASFPAARRIIVAGTVSVLTGLTPETTYYVRVATWDRQTGTPGTWAATPFTTMAREYPLPAPAVALSSEASDAITAEWNSVGNDVRYQVAIGESVATLGRVTDVKDLTTSFTGLAKDTTYYVSVRAVDADGNPSSAWSDPIAGQTAESLPLRVGSFNIRNATIKEGPSWAKRRKPVADTIAGQEVAVVGLQEATWTHVPGRRVSQFGDVINLLGRNWRSTTYVGNAGPEGTRIIYDNEQVKMLRQGYQKLAGSHRRNNWRYVTWAEFVQRSTGKRFFFVNTHFLQKQNKADYNSRKSSATQLVRIIERYNVDNLPTIIVGDFNSHKFRNPENAPYRIITDAGYIDPLDNIDDWRGGPRGIAENRIDAQLFTINEFKRKAMRGNYSTGVMLDQIFVSPMRVSEWQTVARLDSAGRFIGTIPSDHNMIRATVYLP